MSFNYFPFLYEIIGGFFKFFRQQWLIFNKMPFAHYDVFEITHREGRYSVTNGSIRLCVSCFFCVRRGNSV